MIMIIIMIMIMIMIIKMIIIGRRPLTRYERVMQLIFIFLLFLGTAIYADEFKTKEKQKLTEIKN